MPVVDADGRMVVVLGRSDLLAVFLRRDGLIRREVVEEVLGRMLVVDPARIAIEVTDGIVTLTGELDTRVDVELAVRFVEHLEGVVGVEERLSCLADHTLLDVAPLY
ncbi:MAG: BON domain-containing protein [Pseudonocardia sp.]|nr:BON domain-containing protein [Pseudonocardia sp.]